MQQPQLQPQSHEHPQQPQEQVDVVNLDEFAREYFPLKKKSTVAQGLSTNPAQYPPFFLLPGRKHGRFWLRSTIENWFRALDARSGAIISTPPTPAPKSKAGRPSKATLKARKAASASTSTAPLPTQHRTGGAA